MPALGADMEAGTLLEWLVRPGDAVRRGQPVAVVDTDKAAIEIESFDDGTLDAILVEPGTKVAVGSPLATITTTAGEPGPEPATAGQALTAPAASDADRAADGDGASHPTPRVPPPVRHHAAELGVDLTTVHGTGHDGVVTRLDVDRAASSRPAEARPGSRRVSPYARTLARELGVDLEQVTGTGQDGAVGAHDVRAAATSGRPRREDVPSGTPPSEAAGHAASAARDTIAALMSKANREIPHYHVVTTVDMHTVTSWLRRANRDRPIAERMVPAAAILKAAAVAAREHPQLNGFWKNGGFVAAEDVHLGVAISVRDGGALVAPAIHGAADLDLATLMQRLRDLVQRARKGRLTRMELAEPTLTVSDLGDQGVEEVFGVISPPQVALVGVGRMVDRPWAVDGLLGVRPTIRVTLAGDHRATDGYTGARYLATLDELLQSPEEL